MGFGYLLLGYLTAFLLKLTADGIKLPPTYETGFGSVVLLLGYALMAVGLFKLRRYHNRFTVALWSILPLSVLAVYDLAKMICILLRRSPVWMNGTVDSVLSWLTLLFILLFHATLLSAIRGLAQEVGLVKLAAAAVRNLLFFGFYIVFYVLIQIPVEGMDRARPYLILCATIVNLVCLFLNLWLFLSCMKNICPEGEEEQPKHRYRWNFLNLLGDKYAETQERAVETKRREMEERLERRRERQEQKKRK